MTWTTWAQIMLLMLWGAMLVSWLIGLIKAPYREREERTRGR